MRINRMKKLIIAIVAILVIGLLAGCGGGAKKDSGSDLDYIKNNGAIKIGITIYAPMNYYDDSGVLVGFDTEFATALCEQLGVTPDFVEINWDTKEVELAAKNIDCIWNGLTVTEERRENMAFTDPYLLNRQVAVIRVADQGKYTSLESLADAKLCAESGSAGETAIVDDEILGGANYTALPAQTDTLMEVKAGTSDIAVLDYTAANALVGAGTSYDDLMILASIELAPEEYAIGFRIGSDIVPEANKLIDGLFADGTLARIAATYDVTELLPQ